MRIPILTTFDPPAGWDVERVVGPCWGITVRSRSVVGTPAPAARPFFGGEITMFTELANDSRNEAMNRLEQQANVMARTPCSDAFRLVEPLELHKRDHRLWHGGDHPAGSAETLKAPRPPPRGVLVPSRAPRASGRG